MWALKRSTPGCGEPGDPFRIASSVVAVAGSSEGEDDGAALHAIDVDARRRTMGDSFMPLPSARAAPAVKVRGGHDFP
jgi:hypothetical protein